MWTALWFFHWGRFGPKKWSPAYWCAPSLEKIRSNILIQSYFWYMIRRADVSGALPAQWGYLDPLADWSKSGWINWDLEAKCIQKFFSSWKSRCAALFFGASLRALELGVIGIMGAIPLHEFMNQEVFEWLHQQRISQSQKEQLQVLEYSAALGEEKVLSEFLYAHSVNTAQVPSKSIRI